MLAEKDIEKIKNLGCYISGTNEIRCYRLYKKEQIRINMYFSATSALDEMTIDLAAGRKVSQTSQDFEINLSPEYVKALGYTSSKAAVGETVQLGYLKFLERTRASY